LQHHVQSGEVLIGLVMNEINENSLEMQRLPRRGLPGSSQELGYKPIKDCDISRADTCLSEHTLSIIPVAITVKSDQTFADLAAEVSAAIRTGAQKRSCICLDDLRDAVSRPSLFHLVVRMADKEDMDAMHYAAFSASGMSEMRTDVARIEFSFDMHAGTVRLCSRYDAGNYENASIQRLQEQVATLTAKTLAAAPEHLAAQSGIMSADEQRLITQTWAGGTGDVPVAMTLQELLEISLHTVSSEKIAIENPQQGLKLSYLQLDLVTALLAEELKNKYQVGPGWYKH